jgi:hypothetical protein
LAALGSNRRISVNLVDEANEMLKAIPSKDEEENLEENELSLILSCIPDKH